MVGLYSDVQYVELAKSNLLKLKWISDILVNLQLLIYNCITHSSYFFSMGRVDVL